MKTKFLLTLLIIMFSPTGFAQTQSFDAWLQDFKKQAYSNGISMKTLDSAFKGVQPHTRVIELDRDQPEVKFSFERYYNRVVSNARIKKGKKQLVRYRTLLSKLEKQYGVPPHIIVALWGMETSYGRFTGGFNVVQALSTLAYEGRRAEFFSEQLMHALRIIDDGHVSASAMKGSWAGAMGQTQFMPSTFMAYAVDYDGDGRKDIWNNVADALASAANYLSKAGWKKELRWGREVVLVNEIGEELYGLDNKKTLKDWRQAGVLQKNNKPLPNLDFPASLIKVNGGDSAGRTFIVYDNYHVLIEWNRSHNFAVTVGLMADQIKS